MAKSKTNMYKTAGVALIATPLLLYGASSFDASTPSAVGVKVGENSVTQERVLTEVDYEINRYAGQLGLDAAEMPVALRAVLRERVTGRIVRELLLHSLADEIGMVPNDEQVAEHIRGMSQFVVDGKFSATRFNALVDNPTEFVRNMRKDVGGERIEDPFLKAGIVTTDLVDVLTQFQGERRDVRRIAVPVAYDDPAIEVSDEEAEAYYRNRIVDYERPEQVRVEYVHLTIADVADRVSVDEEGLRAAHERRIIAGQAHEERQVSLVKLASEELANATLVDLQGGADFAVTARASSQDSGTREVGGDLGFITRDDLEPDIAQAVFAAGIGDVVGPFSDGDGWLLLKVAGKIGGSDIDFADVRDELVEQVRAEQGEIELNAVASALDEQASELGNGLAQVAAGLGLAVAESDWLTANMTATGAPVPFDEDFVLGEALGEQLRDGDVNSGLLRKDDGSYLVMRVLEHQPHVQLELAEVADEVQVAVRRVKAVQNAIGQLNRGLSDLLAGKPVASLAFDDVEPIEVDQLARASDLAEKGLLEKEREELFSAGVQPSVAGLPAYYGNYFPELEAVVAYRIDAITPGDKGSELLHGLLGKSLATADAELLLSGYLTEESLRVNVEITLPELVAATDGN